MVAQVKQNKIPPLEERIALGLDHDGQPKRKRFITVERAEKWWIEQARKDPFYFIWYITGLEPAAHHKIWMANMFHPDRFRLNIIAARESAKTTITVYSLAWMMAKFPLDTFGIIAVSSDVATDRLMMIRNLFYNQRFKNVFPWIHIDNHRPDTQKEFTIYSDKDGMPYSAWRSAITMSHSELVKNPSIFAAGATGAGVIGKRISGVLLLDDMVNEKWLSDELQTKMLRYIMQTLEPTIMEGGKIWNIGTRWMIDDIYEHLMNNSEWHTITIPAILYDEEGEAFSYWEDFWSLDKLEKKRRTMNDDLLFRIMYLCDPSAATGALFTREQLLRDLPDELPPFVQVWVTTDLATSLQSYADFNVIYVVGVDINQNIYLIDAIRFKDEHDEALRKIYMMCDSAATIWNRLDGLLIEKVNFEVIMQQLVVKQRPDIPTFGVVPKGDKMHRAKTVSYVAKQGRLFINQKIEIIKQIHAEWFNFPLHKYDDTLDPIGLLLQHIFVGETSAQMISVKPTVQAMAKLRKQKREQLKRIRENRLKEHVSNYYDPELKEFIQSK